MALIIPLIVRKLVFLMMYPSLRTLPPRIERRASPHLGHRDHLCDIVKRGELSINQYKLLVRNPKLICKNCGRAAAVATNLCEPVPL